MATVPLVGATGMYTSDSTHGIAVLTVKQENELVGLVHPAGSELKSEVTLRLFAGWPSSVVNVILTLLEFPISVARGLWLGVPTTLLLVVAR